jgi:phage terminase large subunit-like protein
MTQHPLFEKLLGLSEKARLAAMLKLSEVERKELRHHWELWARTAQLQPEGAWHLWLILAGRGFGKTRAGAEWVRRTAEADPEARIALVAASLGEARSVMVEGESGLLDSAVPGRIPQFEPSLRRLTWPNGAQATLYSAGEPESLRGPQHSHARQPVPERRLRQRNHCTPRWLAALCDRSRTGRPPPRLRKMVRAG